jgi:hypothetical protein
VWRVAAGTGLQSCERTCAVWCLAAPAAAAAAAAAITAALCCAAGMVGVRGLAGWPTRELGSSQKGVIFISSESRRAFKSFVNRVLASITFRCWWEPRLYGGSVFYFCMAAARWLY